MTDICIAFWFISILFVVFAHFMGWWEFCRYTKEAQNTTTNNARAEILLNCTSCHWRDHCVCAFNGDICRLKYERKTSPIA